MKKLMIVCVAVTMVLVITHNAMATYSNVGEWGSGPLEPVWQNNADWWSYDIQDNYRIVKLDWTVTNTDPSVTYNDVKMVLPFVWDSGTPLQAFSWVDADNEWIITDRGDGFDGQADGIYAKLPGTLSTETRMLMSDTDLPLSYSYSGYETASVLSTDSVPAWDIIASLAPNETVNFSTYIQVERGAQINAFYVQPYMVAVPEPATLALLGLGGLFLRKTKR